MELRWIMSSPSDRKHFFLVLRGFESVYRSIANGSLFPISLGAKNDDRPPTQGGIQFYS